MELLLAALLNEGAGIFLDGGEGLRDVIVPGEIFLIGDGPEDT